MMNIFEKLARVNEIKEEIVAIEKTLKALKILATTNVRTAERCMMIATELGDRAGKLYEEFENIRKEIDTFARENGLQ